MSSPTNSRIKKNITPVRKSLNTEENLLAIARVNKDLAKTALHAYFRKNNLNDSHVLTFSGIKHANPKEYREGITATMVEGVGKLIGVDTTAWDRRIDCEISRVMNILALIY